GQPFGRHQNVRPYVPDADRPHMAGSPEPGLDLIGDEQAAILLAQLLDLGQVPEARGDEAVRRGDGLDDHRRDVLLAEKVLERDCILEGRLQELGGAVRMEECRRRIVPGRARQSGAAMVGDVECDDFSALRCIARGLDRHVDRFRTAGGEYRIRQVSRRYAGESLCEVRTRSAWKVVVADVQGVEGGAQYRRQLRISVTQREYAAIQVKIEILLSVHVLESIALALAHDEIDAQIVKARDATGNEMIEGGAQNARLVGRAKCGRLIGKAGVTRGAAHYEFTWICRSLERWNNRKYASNSA